jgi:hypothetical protein
MNKLGIGFAILVMLVTGLFQFYIAQLSLGVFTWAAAGYLVKGSVLLLVVCLVLRFERSKIFRFVFLSIFFFLVLFVQFYYLNISVLVAGLLFATSILYLLSLLLRPNYKYLTLPAYISTLSFYLVTMIVLPFLIYLEWLPILWGDQNFVVTELKSQGHNVLFALYGGGPSLLAVLIGSYFAKRT